MLRKLKVSWIFDDTFRMKMATRKDCDDSKFRRLLNFHFKLIWNLMKFISINADITGSNVCAVVRCESEFGKSRHFRILSLMGCDI